jgi:hypothetical protein
LRSATGLPDVERVQTIIAAAHPEIDLKRARMLRCVDALLIARSFAQAGDQAAVSANLRYWRKNASLRQRVRHFLASLIRRP